MKVRERDVTQPLSERLRLGRWYFTPTEQNCYVPTSLEPGTPMLARVCFGSPAASDYDVLDYKCEDYPFAYGTSVLEVELQ